MKFACLNLRKGQAREDLQKGYMLGNDLLQR